MYSFVFVWNVSWILKWIKWKSTIIFNSLPWAQCTRKCDINSLNRNRTVCFRSLSAGASLTNLLEVQRLRNIQMWGQHKMPWCPLDCVRYLSRRNSNSVTLLNRRFSLLIKHLQKQKCVVRVYILYSIVIDLALVVMKPGTEKIVVRRWRNESNVFNTIESTFRRHLFIQSSIDVFVWTWNRSTNRLAVTALRSSIQYILFLVSVSYPHVPVPSTKRNMNSSILRWNAPW